MPGKNGTRSATVRAVTSSTASRSSTDCVLGSPVEPWTEMPCEPDSICHSISLASASRSTAPCSSNGVTTGAIEPRICAGSERNLIRSPPVSCTAAVSACRASRQASYSARRSSPSGNSPRIALALADPLERELLGELLLGAPRATSSASCAGTTTTPSASPTITSPGRTSTPPQATGTFVSSG